MLANFRRGSISSAVVLALLTVFTLPNSVLRAGDEEYSAVTAWRKLEMFERGSNGKLMHRSFDPEKKTWTKWKQLADIEISSSPSALMTGGGTRLAVFFRGPGRKLYHIFRDQETGWSEVIGLGFDRDMKSGPTAAMVGDELTVFARGLDGKLMRIYYDKEQTSWTGWSDVD